MTVDAECWKCGASVADRLLVPGRRVARLAECPACRTELHVCRSCEFYDRNVAKQCRETIAEEVKDKTRANFCDCFQLGVGIFRAQDEHAESTAREQLDALFAPSSKDS